MKYGEAVTSSEANLYPQWQREAIAFIHVPKTGGTTLRSLLTACFPQTHIDPSRLELHSPAVLARYNFFHGHFDYFSTRLIPRNRIRRVSIFRDPVQRLISRYRYYWSHPADTRGRELAHELGPEDFFEHPQITSELDSNNTYLFWFGSSTGDALLLDSLRDEPSEKDLLAVDADADAASNVPAKTLARAIERVVALDGIRDH